MYNLFSSNKKINSKIGKVCKKIKDKTTFYNYAVLIALDLFQAEF